MYFPEELLRMIRCQTGHDTHCCQKMVGAISFNEKMQNCSYWHTIPITTSNYVLKICFFFNLTDQQITSLIVKQLQ